MFNKEGKNMLYITKVIGCNAFVLDTDDWSLEFTSMETIKKAQANGLCFREGISNPIEPEKCLWNKDGSNIFDNCTISRSGKVFTLRSGGKTYKFKATPYGIEFSNGITVKLTVGLKGKDIILYQM